jgi:hypothetical protein
MIRIDSGVLGRINKYGVSRKFISNKFVVQLLERLDTSNGELNPCPRSLTSVDLFIDRFLAFWS